MKVVVVGAGAIGLCSAYYLALAGADVTVLEGRTAGSGASTRNAGWVVPAMSEPVPSPAALRHGLKWIGRRTSPLKVALPTRIADVSFLARMAVSCRPGQYRDGLRATSDLNRQTVGTFAAMETEFGSTLGFEHHHRPMLLAFTDPSGLKEHVQDLHRMQEFGVPAAEQLSGDQIHAAEPALSARVIGGIRCTGQSNLEPGSFIQALVQRCGALGVQIVNGETVTKADLSAGRATAVIGTRRWGADHFVLAAGVWSGRVLRSAGIRLPVMAGKGYGFDLTPAPWQLQHNLYLSNHKVAVSQLDSATRLCGTMEFGGGSDSIDTRRAASILDSARLYLRDWPESAPPEPWSGLRPMTPDGLPIIGPLPGVPNLTIATGHAMLGITLAPITGKLLAQQIIQGELQQVLEPFAAQRFRALRN